MGGAPATGTSSGSKPKKKQGKKAMMAFLGDAAVPASTKKAKAQGGGGQNAQGKSGSGASGDGSSGGGTGMFQWIGSVVFGSGSSSSSTGGSKKNYTKAHMGSGAKPYYDKAKGRWVIPGMNDSDKPKAAPPPPPSTSAAPVAAPAPAPVGMGAQGTPAGTSGGSGAQWQQSYGQGYSQPQPQYHAQPSTGHPRQQGGPMPAQGQWTGASSSGGFSGGVGGSSGAAGQVQPPPAMGSSDSMVGVPGAGVPGGFQVGRPGGAGGAPGGKRRKQKMRPRYAVS